VSVKGPYDFLRDPSDGRLYSAGIPNSHGVAKCLHVLLNSILLFRLQSRGPSHNVCLLFGIR
jgi:hypothetical protein